MLINKKYLRYLPDFYVILFSALFYFKFLTLSKSELINFYPFASVDGFEWYTNGAYLIELIIRGKQEMPMLTILRPPGFVALTSLDYLAGRAGYVIGLAISLAFYLTFKVTDLIVQKLTRGLTQNYSSRWTSWLLAIGLTVAPINFFKPYVLADNFAICLSLFSILFLQNYISYKKNKFILYSLLFASLASITQTYGALPFLVFTIYYLTIGWSGRSWNEIIKLILGIIFLALTYLIIHYMWRNFIPHIATPDNFFFLKTTLNNLAFYQNTWAIMIGPLMMIFVFGLITNFKKIFLTSSLVPFCVLIAIFAILAFFYQWQESRFIYYFWPWLLIVVCSTLAYINSRHGTLLALIFCLSTFWVPKNPWHPDLSQSLISWGGWYVSYLKSTSINRNLNKCISTCTPNDSCSTSCLDNPNFADFNRLNIGTGKTLSIYTFLTKK